MLRREFVKNVALGALAIPAASLAGPADVDRLSAVPRNGKLHARFFRKTADKEVWPEVEPTDIKPGDTILAIGVSSDGLWMATRDVVKEFYLDPEDGVWTSTIVAGTRVNFLAEQKP